MATISDVARLANVSVATVSRVFNGARVSDARTRAVLAAAEQLSFTPNRAARNLRMRRSDLIALIIPDLANPYFTELARGVEDRVIRDGFSLVLCNTDDSKEKERSYLRISRAQEMAGLMMVVADTVHPPAELERLGMPVVVVDRAPDIAVDSVISANADAGRIATKSLIDQGYRRIAFIGGPGYIDTASQRRRGWMDAMSEAKGSLSTVIEVETDFKVGGGYRATLELLDRADPPEAIVAANSLIGVGMLQALTEREILPPRIGAAVIGNLPYSTLSLRNVSIVDLHEYRIGWEGAELLLDRIRGSRVEPRALIVEVGDDIGSLRSMPKQQQEGLRGTR